MSRKLSYQQLIFMMIVLSSGLGVLLGIANDGWSLNGLGYFTNQSNLLVFMVYGYMLINPRKLTKIGIIIVYQAVLAIALTGLVYHFILAPTLDGGGGFSIVNFFVHTLTPSLVVIERIMYAKKKVLTIWHPLYWLAFPFLYFLFTLIFTAFGGRFGVGTDYESRYPYFFLNFNEYGAGYFLFVLLITLILGYAIVYWNNQQKSMSTTEKLTE